MLEIGYPYFYGVLYYKVLLDYSAGNYYAQLHCAGTLVTKDNC